MNVIWYLFDSANGSSNRAWITYPEVAKIGFTHTSIGLDENRANSHHFVSVDLSKHDETIATLQKLINDGIIEKPDVILASPPCESWSMADAANLIFNVKTFLPWSHEEYVSRTSWHKRKPNETRKRESWENGKNCISTTWQIIETFKPKVWVIENGTSTKIWDYQRKIMGRVLPYLNKTYYNNYGFSIAKPTTFASNIDLKLDNTRHKAKCVMSYNKNSKNKVMGVSEDYNERSNIPEKLLHNIFDSIIKYMKN